MRKMRKLRTAVVVAALLLCVTLVACMILADRDIAGENTVSIDDIPEYSGEAFVVVNGNVPQFDEDLLTEDSFEKYSRLDRLGRCGAALANVGLDIMPTEDRGDISSVYPTGWEQEQYDFVDGKSLYNRCHLIGFQLTGENANERNLITGTRYMNVTGMLPFENMIADYVKETGNHVLFRVTPIFEGDDLVAKGVQMEALSVEDAGDGVSFNVFCYNVQPGVEIDYATGENSEAENAMGESDGDVTYILNKNSRKFHLPDCAGVEDIKEANRQNYTGSRDMLIAQGYEPCGRCDP